MQFCLFTLVLARYRRQESVRVRLAYAEAVTMIPKRFKSSSEQSAVVSVFPVFNEICALLYRHRSAQHIPVPDPFNIPEELRSTVRGKNVGPEDEKNNERFLLYLGQDRKVLVFCCDMELLTLFNSEYVIGDGTFKMVPGSSYQLYTLHGFLHGEGQALVWGSFLTSPKPHTLNCPLQFDKPLQTDINN